MSSDPQGPSPSDRSRILILFLTANPPGTSELQTGEEFEQIRAALRTARHRDRFRLDIVHNLASRDLQRHLLDQGPDIVHFSAHGRRTGELLLHTTSRHLTVAADPTPPPIEESQRASPFARAFPQLFALAADSVRCVVLNACHSHEQAREVAQHVDFVVGMTREIDDRAALHFSHGFYQGLANGRSIRDAFELGRNQIGLNDLPDRQTPRLFHHPAADPEAILLEEIGQPLDAVRQALENGEFDQARRLLDAELQPGADPARIHTYRALALLEGRHFNSLHPSERARIERHLATARRHDPELALPHLLLYVLEIDYYRYHGKVSENPVSDAEPGSLEGRLSEEDQRLFEQLDRSDRLESALCRSPA